MIKGIIIWYRQVTTQEGENLAKERNYIFQEVSAKTAANINTLFYQDIFTQIAKKYNLISGQAENNFNEMENEIGSNGIKLEEQGKIETEKKKKCCWKL